MSHRNHSSVVVVSFSVVVKICVVVGGYVIGSVVIGFVVVDSVVVDSVVVDSDVVDSDVVDSVVIGSVVIGSVVTGIVSVVVVVLDICSHLRQTPSALASLGRYTRWTSVSDDGNLIESMAVHTVHPCSP